MTQNNGEKEVPTTEALVEEIDSEEGATMVEYALLAALIAVICIAGIRLIGRQASMKFSTIGSELKNG